MWSLHVDETVTDRKQIATGDSLFLRTGDSSICRSVSERGRAVQLLLLPSFARRDRRVQVLVYDFDHLAGPTQAFDVCVHLRSQGRNQFDWIVLFHASKVADLRNDSSLHAPILVLSFSPDKFYGPDCAALFLSTFLSRSYLFSRIS